MPRHIHHRISSAVISVKKISIFFKCMYSETGMLALEKNVYSVSEEIGFSAFSMRRSPLNLLGRNNPKLDKKKQLNGEKCT